MAGPWIDYIARRSYLLQQGRFVADVAYFVGEDEPAGTLAADGRLTDLPRRHAFDFVNATAILKQFEVDKGELVTPGGARYRALYLSGTSDRMTLPVLQRIAELVEKGATVVGDAPHSSPSLADNPDEFAALVRKMWSGKAVTGLGKGRVVSGRDVEAALERHGTAPDFAVMVANSDEAGVPKIDFVHRALADGEIYYLHNPALQPVTFEASFRVVGKQPELWDAVTGKVSLLSYRIENGRTIVPLSLADEKSLFVIFRRPTTARARVVSMPKPIEIAQLNQSWAVWFQTGRGAPASIDLPALSPLNENADPGIRYFFGVASYRTTLTVSRSAARERHLLLDLGKVGDLAEVWVNGKLAGSPWAAPYRVDITSFVKPGANRLEVRVANLWVNRLIGDAQPGAHKVAWTAMPTYTAAAPLRPSGLIGPVTLLEQ
ncbi:MAG TPA: glycosyl hydrolase [Sphingobium sp.]|uniref:glycosyl hydrolase n=1 Tax=Sphingobium sp. TaxID=1912891 RepID=UPI002ED41DF2